MVAPAIHKKISPKAMPAGGNIADVGESSEPIAVPRIPVQPLSPERPFDQIAAGNISRKIIDPALDIRDRPPPALGIPDRLVGEAVFCHYPSYRADCADDIFRRRIVFI